MARLAQGPQVQSIPLRGRDGAATGATVTLRLEQGATAFTNGDGSPRSGAAGQGGQGVHSYGSLARGAAENGAHSEFSFLDTVSSPLFGVEGLSAAPARASGYGATSPLLNV